MSLKERPEAELFGDTRDKLVGDDGFEGGGDEG
jgi:hypothetical protein